MMESKSELIVVANRLPVRLRRRGGEEFWDTSPGGLVSALMPILQREREQGHRGAWVGWSGSRTRSFDGFEHEGVWNEPVNLDRREVRGYYDGMANGGLWPLYHDVVRKPTYSRSCWRTYESVNRKFADAAAEEAALGASVWVHDYHLHLVPLMLRRMRPDLRIGFFLHTPFPGLRLFSQAPWREALVRGTLGANVIGFQTESDASNFRDAAAHHGGAIVEGDEVRFNDHSVMIDSFPISIDARKIDEIARRDSVMKAAARQRHRVGDRKIVLGVDRMDYTKGIPIRLRAFQDLLRNGRVSPSEAAFIQSCVPTRERVETYADLRSEVEELVGQINGEFGEVGRGCVHYLRQSLPMEELVALYLAADVLLVTPLCDGMNLIAKEYVAARHDERGALVLSEFAGAANELSDALLVNPHDLNGVAGALERALSMDGQEASRRMGALRRTVFGHDVYAWADSFMSSLRGSSGARSRVESRPARPSGRAVEEPAGYGVDRA